MLFDLQHRERDGWTVLAVVGELDLSAAPRVRQAAQRLMSGSGRAGGESPRVIVDLSSTAFLDSAGLGVVLGVIRRARQAGGRAAVVVDRSSPPGRVFSVLDLARAVPVAADLDEVRARDLAGTLDPPAVTVPSAAGEEGGQRG